jgi:hypothetical protein
VNRFSKHPIHGLLDKVQELKEGPYNGRTTASYRLHKGLPQII